MQQQYNHGGRKNFRHCVESESDCVRNGVQLHGRIAAKRWLALELSHHITPQWYSRIISDCDDHIVGDQMLQVRCSFTDVVRSGERVTSTLSRMLLL